MRYGMFTHGDCFEKVQEVPADSVDMLNADPPYGYDFMGKDWDKAVIPVKFWKAFYRVLKPGSVSCVMSAPRQDVYLKILKNLRDAGFLIANTPVYWAYAQGFNKGTDIARKIDKRLGVKRKVVGPNPNARPNSQPLYSLDGNEKNFLINARMRTVATSDLAKKFEGAWSGFQPKPAHEIIILIKKGGKPVNQTTFSEFVVVPKAPQSERWKYCKLCKEPFNPYIDSSHDSHAYHCSLCDEFVSKDELKNDHKPGTGGHKKAHITSFWEKHPTQKPEKLFDYLIETFSKPGDTVLDPFTGSGTTPVSAVKTGREYLGFEKDRLYFTVAKARIEAREQIQIEKELEIKMGLGAWL